MKIKDKPQTVLRELFGSMKFGDSRKVLKKVRKEFKDMKNVEFKQK